MKLNVGNLESFFRIFMGVIILYSALHAYIGWGWGFLGGFIVATGLSRFSPTRAVLGLNGFDSENKSSSAH
jgi:hypothetical protein